MEVQDGLFLSMMSGSVCGIVIWSATGLLGGITMAQLVKRLFKSISEDGFRAIVVGWWIGIVVGFTFGYIAIALVESMFLRVLAILIGGFIAGGIGSGSMYRVIDHEMQG